MLRFFTLFLFAFIMVNTLQSNRTVEKNFCDRYDLAPLNKNSLKEYIKTKSLTKEMESLLYIVAIIETGHLKISRCSKEYNNLYGMKMPRQRKTVAIGSGKNDYAKYTHWTKSVDDVLMLMKARNVESYDGFYSYLTTRWSTNDDYKVLLDKMIKQYS